MKEYILALVFQMIDEDRLEPIVFSRLGDFAGSAGSLTIP